jgi:threonine dehydrogenase-like Zn-dependent dehydrogenase
MAERRTLNPEVTKKIPRRFCNPNGRPVGSKNRATKIVENILALKKDGILPHEFMLEVVRGNPIKHGKDEDGKPVMYQPTFEERIECAKAAAPYFAPRLSTIEVVKNLTDDNLDSIIKAAADASGVLLEFNKHLNEDGTTTYVGEDAIEEVIGDDDN